MKLNWHENAYTYLIYISFVLYFIAITGIIIVNPTYLTYIKTITNLYVSIILIIKFNPLRKIKKLTQFDKNLIFSSAMLILLSSSLGLAVENFLKKKLHILKK